MSPSAARLSLSVTTYQCQPCWFDPVGACVAMSMHSRTSSRGTGLSKSSRLRTARVVVSSSSAVRSRVAPIPATLRAPPSPRPLRPHWTNGDTRCRLRSTLVGSDHMWAKATRGVASGPHSFTGEMWTNRDTRCRLRSTCATARTFVDGRRQSVSPGAQCGLRATSEGVGEGDLAEPVRSRLGGTDERGAVHRHETELGSVAEGPLEVVEQAPVRVA